MYLYSLTGNAKNQPGGFVWLQWHLRELQMLLCTVRARLNVNSRPPALLPDSATPSALRAAQGNNPAA